MNFYIIFLLFNLVMCIFSKNIITKSGLDEPISCSVGLKFFATINNTSGEDCNVEVHPDECCLDAHDEKCNVIEIIGSAAEIIPEGTTKRLELVAPLLDLYDRRGYCTIYVDCKSKTRPKNFIRDTIKIKFDTTLHPSNLPDDGKICKHIDEDPMNECKPVHCDTYYNGKKPYYNILKKQCVEAPSCLGNVNTEIPKTAYNPTSNKCVHKPAISNDDINFIKALTRGRDRRAKDRKTKDVLIIKMIEMNSTASNDFDRSEFSTVSRITGVTTKKASQKTNNKYKTLHFVNKKPETIHYIVQYLTHNKYTLIVLSCVILLQCCLICTLVYCLTKNCRCFKKKKDIQKIFNYRQDASVTTPLICTSNIDTETTEYQYLSESSNYIDKKIKCYKACQKERKNNIKLSMSDDILSKCITRRDWRRLPRSETIPEVRNDDECKINGKKDYPDHKKTTDTKVNFQDEIRDKKTKAIKSIVNKKTDNKASAEPLSDSSEKVIRCHSYNYDSNLTGFKKSTQSKTFGLYQEKKTDSTEQGAQAYFSNDSIDDFLSERGVIFIGDNASKYSFTSISSAAKSSVSSQSSKTSKNNMVKNVMSMLSRKPKGPSSDPGGKKSKQDLDLELLHISRASVGSSSNDTDPCKDLKIIKDSTSSL